MRISEILEPNDIFEVFKNSQLVELDQLYDTLSNVSANFYVPIFASNAEIADEYREAFVRIDTLINENMLSPIWLQKLMQLRNYFNN